MSAEEIQESGVADEAPPESAAAPEPPPQPELRRRPQDVPKVHVWPHLIRMEFICTLLVTAFMLFWSIMVDAPLEEAANPTKTPNPSKAPWYFLGLQEMLVYFDPWMAGVVLPSLIIVGLMAIPYIDINPRGNGYYTLRERPFAMGNFIFGFLILWIILIINGVFLRGPGWNFFLPWQEWDPHKVVALTNRDFHEFLGIRTPALIYIAGAIPLGAYFSLAPAYWYWRKDKSPVLKELGATRYYITAGLFLTMWLLPIKMALRILFDLKNIWVTPYFNI